MNSQTVFNQIANRKLYMARFYCYGFGDELTRFTGDGGSWEEEGDFAFPDKDEGEVDDTGNGQLFVMTKIFRRDYQSGVEYYFPYYDGDGGSNGEVFQLSGPYSKDDEA